MIKYLKNVDFAEAKHMQGNRVRRITVQYPAIGRGSNHLMSELTSKLD
jgi:hypothetical protein